MSAESQVAALKSKLKLGKYRHCTRKDGLYEVLGVANHSETLEPLVIYRALYTSSDFGENALWARPLAMFLEEVEVNGVKQARFTYLGQ